MINDAGTEFSLVTLVPCSNSPSTLLNVLKYILNGILKKRGRGEEHRDIFSVIFRHLLSSHSKVTEMELSERIMSK